MFGIPFIRNVHNEQMRQKPRVVVPDRVNPPIAMVLLAVIQKLDF